MTSKKFDFNNLAGSVFQVAYLWVVGFAVLVTLFVLSFHFVDMYENYSKVSNLQIHDVGRIHQMNGVSDNCELIITEKGQRSVKGTSARCQQMFQMAPEWASHTSKPTDVGGMVFSVVLTMVFTAAGWVVSVFPAVATVFILRPLGVFYPLIRMLFTVPFFALALVYSFAWVTTPPSYWKMDGWAVSTSEVYITNDHKIYTKPSTFNDWADSSKAGMHLSYVEWHPQ